MTEKIRAEIRAHKTIKKVAVYWQGEGTYLFIPALNMYARVLCIETLDLAMKQQQEVIHIAEDQTIRF